MKKVKKSPVILNARKKFEVRTNCEYVLWVEADNAEEALKKAETLSMDDMSEWDLSWAPWTAEEV